MWGKKKDKRKRKKEEGLKDGNKMHGIHTSPLSPYLIISLFDASIASNKEHSTTCLQLGYVLQGCFINSNIATYLT